MEPFCLVVNELPDITEPERIFIEKIREQIMDAKTEFMSHCTTISTLPGIFPIPTFETHNIYDDDLIEAIKSHNKCTRIIVSIFPQEKNLQVENRNWLKKHQIRYNIEIIIEDQTQLWINSDNYFSVRAKIPVEMLKNIVEMIFLDVLFEESFRKHSEYSKVLNTVDPLFLSESKVNFLDKYLKLPKENEGIKYYPFSYIVRKDSHYKKNDFVEMQNLWFKYLIWETLRINAKKNNRNLAILPEPTFLPTFINLDDVKEILPLKLIGQMQHQTPKLPKEPNPYIWLIQKRKADKKIEDQVENIFSGKSHPNKSRIVPYSWKDRIKKISSYFYILPFKLAEVKKHGNKRRK